ncbi:hypothetical protein RFI_16592, partial [Reticulomyxa filosa]
MSDCWESYLAKFGKEPQNAQQLLNYAQKDLKLTLTFKDAREIYDTHKGKSEQPKASASSAQASQSATVTAQKQEEKQDSGKTALFQQLNQSNVGGLKKEKDVKIEIKKKKKKKKKKKI